MKWKRALSLTLTFSMLASTLPAPAMAAGESNTAEGYTDPWKADAAITTKTAKEAITSPTFTGKEWTGTDGNEDVFAINREEASTFSTSGVIYDSVKAALKSAINFDKDASGYVQFLTGENQADWSLRVVKNDTIAKESYADFYKTDYTPDDAWSTNLQLPASWTYWNLDYPIYTNTQVPWQEDNTSSDTAPAAPVNYNPVGMYRKTFTLDDSLKALKEQNGRIYINFQGVEAAYYVYLNGQAVGYSEDTYSPHSFDITDYLVDGENLLAVEVHKFCDGTWFELQDMFKDGGIFRDVYVYGATQVHIDDYFVTTDLDETYENANLNLAVTVENESAETVNGYKLDVRVYNEDGTMFVNGVTADVPAIEAGGEQTVDIAKYVQNPELWSAEVPNLYYLVISLYEEGGAYLGSMSQQLGFREIEFTRTEVDENGNRTTQDSEYKPITINGQPLVFRGTNRHDTDPVYGKYVSHEVQEADVVLMKQYNINAIRTSHYSNDDYLYYLCNKYGLYMMGETNLESHQLMNNSGKQVLFKEMAMDRTITAFNRLKNVSAIVAWSTGNENYYSSSANYADGMFSDLIWYFKDHDTTRPVHSESSGKSNGTDMGSNMYPSVSTVQSEAKNNMPYVMCEYDHAMGNAVGSIKEYWDAVRSGDNMLGGFIWDWVDQARTTPFTVTDNWAMTDKTGVDAVLTGSLNENVTDPAAMNDVSWTGYAVFENTTKFDNALSGTDKSFTLEVFCKPESLTGAQILIAKGDKQVAIKTQDEGFQFFTYDGTWETLSTPVPDNWLNNWHQVVAVYDKGAMSIYVDGELMGSATKPNQISSSSEQLAVGYQTDKGDRFSGEISLARVYNKALTLDEINAQRSADPAITVDDEVVLLWADYTGITERESTTYNYYVEDYAYYNTDLYTVDQIDGQFFGYGGDTGDYRNNSGNFCQNGLVTPDRVAQPELYEVKYQYQSFWFTADEADLLRGAITVENENGFVNLNDYNVTWQLMENGTELASGTVDASVAPQETKEILVPYMSAMPETPKNGAEYYLNIVVSLKNDTLWAKAGHEVAHEQFQVPANVNQVTYTPSSDGVTVDKETDPDVITVTGTDFSFNIDKTSGAISNYVYGGETLLKEGPVPNFWRAPVNNDNGNFDWSWQNAGKNAAIDGEITVGADDANRTTISFTLTFPNMAGLTETMIYTVEGNGAVTLDTTVDGTKTDTSKDRFMRIGTTMTLPAGYENVTWYGNGPVEAMWDRESFAMVGQYESTVNKLFFPYLDTEDTGTLTGVKWFTVTSDTSPVAMAIAAEDTVEAQALHFTADDLTQARHPYELTYEDETFLSINYRSQGTGNASCGPDVLGQYTLPTSQTYTYSYTMVPYTVEDADLYDVTAPYRTASVVSEDAAVEALKAQINGLVVTSADQLDEAKALLASYNDLPDNLKEQMGADAEAYLNAQIAIAEKMAADPYYHAFVRDQSANGFDVDLTEKADTVTMKMDDKQGTYLTGHFLVDNEGAMEAMNDVIGGTNSFTIEAYIRPNVYSTDGSNFNMIVGKGDSCMAFRISGGNLYFFTYNGSSWMPTPLDGQPSNFPMNETLVKQWLHVAAVYDGETEGGTLSVYLNGELSSTRTNVGQVKASDLALGIGLCPDTGRTSASDFSQVHLYSSALTGEELKADDETKLAREDVALWYDFGALEYGATGEITVVTELPAVAYLGDDTFTLPTEIQISVDGGEPTNATIIWNADQLAAIQTATTVGTYDVNGTLENGKIIKHTVTVVPNDVVYFVDAGAAEFTALGQTMVDANADTICNDKSDQAYTAESGWGYLNGDDLGTDNGTSGSAYATLRHMTKEATGNSLSYQFDGLTAGTYNIYIGYYDPWTQWSTTRPATITLNQGDAALATLTGVDLCSAQPKYVTMENVEVADGAVTLTLAPEKTGDSNYDVLVSYIVITRVDGEEPEPETYTVTVKTEGEGTASANVETAKEGDNVTLTQKASEGWHFIKWVSSDVDVEDNSFTMPASDVTVTAVFEEDAPVVVPVEGVKLDKNELPLTVGDTAPLTATVAPENATNKNVTWSSNNEEVATVVDGKVTAVTAGEATITVTTEDGGHTATCAVTVREKPADSFTVTFMDGETEHSKATVTSGQTVAKPTAPVKDGYTFTGWYTEDGAEYDFTAPVTADLTLYAGWEEIPEPETVTVTFNTNGGSKIEAVTVEKGAKVNAPDAPTNGDFEFDGWYIDPACTQPYDFDKAVTEDITLYAGWKMVGPSVDHDDDKDEPEEPEEPTDPEEPGTDIEDPDTPLNPAPEFTDVADDFWGKEAIDYVVGEGLMNGTSETTFAPNVTTTRAMLMTILARMDGVDTTGSNPWYQKGMEWAVAEGVSDGTNPEGTITREQLAVMLYRYAGSPESSGTALDCADADQISDWAYMGMHWAVSNGILSGKGNDTLDPQGNATRAEIAQMLYNFSKIG